MKTIGPQKAVQELKQSNGLVIDVRSEEEYVRHHITDSLNIPEERLQAECARWDADQKIYLICRSGRRSARCLAVLNDLGFWNVYNIDGGIVAFEKAGGRTVRTKAPIPLMRQVLVAAGTLSLVGFSFAFFLHPYFLWLSVLVSAGLVFSGLSGFCGLALLLEKMPWNRPPSGVAQSNVLTGAHERQT